MARGRLFGLLLMLLEQLAARQPLVLVIEDLHWADRSTGELLAFLVRNLRQAAVLLVATFRSDELGQAGPVRRLLAELGRLDGVTRLELGRLSSSEVTAQLAASWAARPTLRSQLRCMSVAAGPVARRGFAERRRHDHPGAAHPGAGPAARRGKRPASGLSAGAAESGGRRRRDRVPAAGQGDWAGRQGTR